MIRKINIYLSIFLVFIFFQHVVPSRHHNTDMIVHHSEELNDKENKIFTNTENLNFHPPHPPLHGPPLLSRCKKLARASGIVQGSEGRLEARAGVGGTLLGTDRRSFVPKISAFTSKIKIFNLPATSACALPCFRGAKPIEGCLGF